MNQRGFTLAELLVVIAVLGLVMAGVILLQEQGQRAYLFGSNRVEVQQNARIALELMTREVRAACAVASIASTQIEFSMVPPTAAANADCSAGGLLTVRYAQSGSALYRDESAGALPAVGAGAVLIGGVDAFTLTGIDADNAATTTPASVRSVAIELRTRSEESLASYAPGSVRASIASRVRLKNIP
jgi:type IV pilus assembly protein PilW